MAVRVLSTPSARADAQMVVSQNVRAWVEAKTKLGIVENLGLAGEPIIANLNGTHDVYALQADPPGPLIIALHAPGVQPPTLEVVGFNSQLKHPLSNAEINRLTREAAQSANIPFIGMSNVYAP